MTWSATARLTALFAAAVLTSACTSDALVTKDRLPELVLAPSDLPRDFVAFDEGAMGRADLAPGPREDPQRFGRVGGWKARYRRTGPQETSGPLVVESLADVFEDVEGAEQDLAAYEEELRAQAGPGAGALRLLDPPDLGDEALAASAAGDGTAGRVLTFTIVWRSANVTASIGVTGFSDGLSLDEVLALAGLQQQRIERALD